MAFAAATDDTRPILGGVRIALKGDVASFAAADSFRLAFRDIALDAPVATAQEVVVPARMLSMLGKALVGVECDVAMWIAPGGNQVMFRAEGLHLVARYRRRLPEHRQIPGHRYRPSSPTSTPSSSNTRRAASSHAAATIRGEIDLAIVPTNHLLARSW